MKIILDWRTVEQPEDGPEEAGVYAMVGHVYGTDQRQLLYIGEAKKSVKKRWNDPKHYDWLRGELRHPLGSLHCATMSDEALISDVESMLIFVHQPNQNSSKLNNIKLNKLFSGERTVIENVGDIPFGMLSDLDSHHEYWDYYAAE